ncbi:hypothetical protein RHOSPDRAFT_24124 [Rhodotorula sp. JG-1b]|nr:hypothetical protein RHOSPDRAFT_24124 [Rhodotorula sp. JG-1b]
MPRSCCRTLVLVLVSLVYPVGAPVAIAFSRGCGVVLFVDTALILLGVGVGGFFSGWSFEPIGVLKLSFGYGLAVLLAWFVIWEASLLMHPELASMTDHTSGAPMHVLEEGKLSTPHGRQRRQRAGNSRLAELGRSELGTQRAAYSGQLDSGSSDDTADEVKQRRRATAQALVQSASRDRSGIHRLSRTSKHSTALIAQHSSAMPPKFNNARESAAPYNRAARRSSARSAPTTDATAPTPSSSLLKTPSPLRAVGSAPSTPPSPSGPSRKRRHDDDDEEQVAEVAATSPLESTSASSSLVTPPLAKKRRSVEPDSSVVVAATVVEEQVAPSLPSSPLLPTSPSQLEVAPEPCAASSSPASPSAASSSLSSSASPLSSPSSPSSESSPAQSLASTAPSSPPRSTEPWSPASSSKSLSDHSTSTSDLPVSVAPARTEVATSSSAGPTSRVDIGVQTDAAEDLADDSTAIFALRCSLEEANVQIVELERERDQKETSTAELHRKNSEDLVSQGDSIFARLQSDLSERTAERDTARAKITELESALEQLQAHVRDVEAGRLQDRQHAEQSMQQLADAHAQNLAALTANYRAKQLEERKDAETAIQNLAGSHAQYVAKLNDECRAKQLEANEKAEKAIKEHTEAQTRDLTAVTTAHQTKQAEDRTAAEKALKELADAHAQEIAALTAKHQVDVDEAKAYFATITSQSEQLEREKQRAESALERDRQSHARTKLVLHGLADAVKAMDPPLPCTICAALFSNLDTLGSQSHIPSASCAVQPANIPRIHISDDPRNMRIVELESESDGDSSDDDDDDNDDGMKSESEDEDEDEDEGARANNRRIIYNCIEFTWSRRAESRPTSATMNPR